MSMMSAHPLKMPNDAMNCAEQLSDARGSFIRTWRCEVVSALADAFAQLNAALEISDAAERGQWNSRTEF
jgi:hypothetical protein